MEKIDIIALDITNALKRLETDEERKEVIGELKIWVCHCCGRLTEVDEFCFCERDD